MSCGAGLQDPSWQPKIELDNGVSYKCEGAWDQLYQSMLDAKHVIYITGARLLRLCPIKRGWHLPSGLAAVLP